MKFFSDIRLLLLAIWLGAAVFFIAVAQSSFAVLPQRELAGLVVNRTLMILNYGGLGISALLILSSFVGGSTVSKLWLWIERFLLLIVAAACAVGQFVIGLMLMSVRAQMGGRPIDEIAVDDPLRIQFNTLHQYSEWTLMAAMVAALIVFFIIANRKFGVVSKLSKDSGETTSNPFDFDKPFKKS
jgi:hypothetical protein